MNEEFKLIITADSEEYENNYIKKYSCSCGGKYQILFREKFQKDDMICNKVKVVCQKCNNPGEFLFDITGRVKDKQPEEKLERKPNKKKSPTRTRLPGSAPSESPDILLDIAKEIEDGFIFSEDFTNLPCADEEKNTPVKHTGTHKGNDGELPDDYDELKFLYAKAMMKIGFLEEEVKSLKPLRHEVRKKDKEIKNMESKIKELSVELEDKTGEIEDMTVQIDETERELKKARKKLEEVKNELEEYKKQHGERKKSGWRNLLGG